MRALITAALLIVATCAGPACSVGSTAAARRSAPDRPVFTVCTTFIADGSYDREMAALHEAEQSMAASPDILFRRHFQSETQRQLLWSVTQWRSEERHNATAQSIMKTRRDDRVASAAFEPYYETFCDEVEGMRVGRHSAQLRFVVVGHGLIDPRTRVDYLGRRGAALRKLRGRFDWLRVFQNRYQPDEFFFFMGFKSRADYERARSVGPLTLEETLFTGLAAPGRMSLLASYNQFPCRPLEP